MRTFEWSPISRLQIGTSAIGLMWPLTAIPIMQHSGWISTSIGSVYFWAALSLWSLVVIDLWRLTTGRR